MGGYYYMLNTNAVTIIINVKDKKNIDRIKDIFVKLKCPEYIKVSVVLMNCDNIAKAYNIAKSKITTKYKLYIREDVVYVNPNIFILIGLIIRIYKDNFIAGNLGSYMPLDGNYVENNKLYGMYHYFDNGVVVNGEKESSILYRRNAHVLESGVLFTDLDYEWDESVVLLLKRKNNL